MSGQSLTSAKTPFTICPLDISIYVQEERTEGERENKEEIKKNCVFKPKERVQKAHQSAHQGYFAWTAAKGQETATPFII